jgi:hypothetical protein
MEVPSSVDNQPNWENRILPRRSAATANIKTDKTTASDYDGCTYNTAIGISLTRRLHWAVPPAQLSDLSGLRKALASQHGCRRPFPYYCAATFGKHQDTRHGPFWLVIDPDWPFALCMKGRLDLIRKRLMEERSLT